MKKLIICILCFASTQAFAQVRLGLTGSFTAANCWQGENVPGVPTNAITGEISTFDAGLVLEYDLGTSGFILQPSLVYAENGTHLTNRQGFVDNADYVIGLSDTYMHIYSLRLPVNLVYKFAVTDKWRVFGGIGPYIAKNLSGTEKGYYQVVYNNTNEAANIPINNTMKASNDNSYAPAGTFNVNPIDVGADFLLGISYKRFDISASFNRGFTRLYHNQYTTLDNQFWNFTVAYTIAGHYRKPKL